MIHPYAIRVLTAVDHLKSLCFALGLPWLETSEIARKLFQGTWLNTAEAFEYVSRAISRGETVDREWLQRELTGRPRASLIFPDDAGPSIQSSH